MGSLSDGAHQADDGEINCQGDGADEEDQEEHQHRLEDAEEVLDAARDDLVVIVGDVFQGLVQAAGGFAHRHHAQDHGGKDGLAVHGLADGRSAFDGQLDLGHSLFDGGIADQAALAQAQRLQDRNARAVEDGQVVREAAGETPAHRDADGGQQERRHPEPPGGVEEIPRAQDDAGKNGLFDIKMVQQLGELGDDKREQENDEGKDDGDDDRRIKRGLADVGHDLLDPLQVLSQVLERLRQLAAQLAGADDADEVGRENRRITGQRLVELEAGFELALQAIEHLLKAGVLAVLGGDFQRAAKRDADANLEGHQGAEINQLAAAAFAAHLEPAQVRLGNGVRRGAGLFEGGFGEPQPDMLEPHLEVGLVQRRHHAGEAAPAFVYGFIAKYWHKLKSEIRRPKSERTPNPEGRNPNSRGRRASARAVNSCGPQVARINHMTRSTIEQLKTQQFVVRNPGQRLMTNPQEPKEEARQRTRLGDLLFAAPSDFVIWYSVPPTRDRISGFGFRISGSLRRQPRHPQQFLDRRHALHGLDQAVVEHGFHALFLGQSHVFGCAQPAQDGIMKPLVQHHQLEDALPAFVTALVAFRATRPAPQLWLRVAGRRLDSQPLKDRLRVYDFFFAMLANRADQPLGQHRQETCRQQEWVHSHVYQARNRPGGVVRVQSREDQVAGQGRAHHQLRRLGVPRLAHQNDVRVLAQQGDS